MTTIFKSFFLTLLLLAVVQFSFAQVQTIVKGNVIDKNNAPLSGATVLLFNANDSTLRSSAMTDEKGNYEFHDLPAGVYYTSVTSVGYESAEGRRFNLTNSAVYFCDTTALSVREKELATVTIMGKKASFIEAKMDKLLVNVDNSPLAAGSSVFEVLEKSPGVSADKDGNISMQGKSGVQILIDGRPTYMSGAEATNMLKNMQSSDVQSIELIANPSAKYDASGNAGIINIKTKKSKALGTNGNITAGAGYGNYPKANAGISLNNRSQKLNLFGTFNAGYDKNSRDLIIDRLVGVVENKTYFNQSSNQESANKNYRLKIGADYNINKNNLIGFIVNSYQTREDQQMFSATMMQKNLGVVDSSLDANNFFKNNYRNNSYNLNFRSALSPKGEELSVDLDYSKYHSDANAFYNNYYYNSAKQSTRDPFFSRNVTETSIEIHSAKVDYAKPITTTLKLEAGAKTAWIHSGNHLSYFNKSDEKWQDDATKSNEFLYNENVNAAYVNASDQWQNTSVQVGLRAEYSITKGNSITDNKVVSRDYLNLFPSIFINQKLNENNKLRFSYSRRIQRPDYESLNPFVYSIDEYTFQQGNPFLNPQYSNSYELSFLNRNKYLMQVGYSSVSDIITEVILSDTARKVLYQTNENIASEKLLRVTLSAPVQITKWWQSYNNFNGINMSFTSPDLKGQQLDVSQFFVMMNTIQNFKVSKTISAEMSAKYTSPLTYGTFKLRSEFSMDAGISKSVLSKKGSLKIAVTDIFNTKQQHLTSVYPGMNYKLNQKLETRVARISFTYRFGNSNVKAARNKATGLETEQSRLKSVEN